MTHIDTLKQAAQALRRAQYLYGANDPQAVEAISLAAALEAMAEQQPEHDAQVRNAALPLDPTKEPFNTFHNPDAEKPDSKPAAEIARAFGAPDMAAALDAPAAATVPGDEREAFEAWAKRQDLWTEQYADMAYRDNTTVRCWEAWQARAALAAPSAPQKCRSTEKVQEQPESAGDAGAPLEQPSDEGIIRLACLKGLADWNEGAAESCCLESTNIREQLLDFARALLSGHGATRQAEEDAQPVAWEVHPYPIETFVREDEAVARLRDQQKFNGWPNAFIRPVCRDGSATPQPAAPAAPAGSIQWTEEAILAAMEASLLGRASVDDDSYVRSILDAALTTQGASHG